MRGKGVLPVGPAGVPPALSRTAGRMPASPTAGTAVPRFAVAEVPLGLPSFILDAFALRSSLARSLLRMTHADGPGAAIPWMNMSDSKTANAGPAGADGPGTSCAASCTWLIQAEEFTRREPVKAVAWAFGAGLILHLLPTRATTAVVLGLARPVLLCLGLLKAWELCPCDKKSTI